MRWWDTLRLRVRSLVCGSRVDQELDAELQFHLDELTAEFVEAGLTPDAARAAARRAMGGVAQIAEECRDTWRVALVETVWRDMRYGARLLAKHPAFTAVTILTLAIGIGFNTFAFSAGRALLFAHLPVDEPDRLILGESLREGFDPGGSSLIEYAALRGLPVFSRAAVSIDRTLRLHDAPEAELVDGAAVSDGFFETLGVTPMLGRVFSADESRPGGPRAVLLGQGYWQRRFGGDPGVVGRTLHLDDRAYTVVGVLPRGFDYPNRTAAWIALDVDPVAAPLPVRTIKSYIFVARLAPAVTFAMALDRVKEAARGLAAEYVSERGWSYGLLTMRQWSIGDDEGRVTVAIVVLLLGGGFLLLLCSVNVASLLLVRSVVRERELAIRVGLGASAGRVARQLFTEGALLSGAGAAAGLAVAWSARRAFAILSPITPHAFGELVTDIQLDSRALLFCLAITALTGIICTAAPAIRLAGVQDPIVMLRERERRAGGAAAARGWLRALVVIEIGVAASLSFGGALLTKSFYRLDRLDLGFRPAHLLAIRLPLFAADYPTQAAKTALVDRVLERVRTVAGIQSAGVTTTLPLEDFSPDAVFTVEGHPPRNPSDVPVAAIRYVSAGYAETLGLTLVEGRLTTDQDRADTQPVAVITEELARQSFGGKDALGKRLRRGRQQDTAFPWMTVVGVVRDAKEDRLNFRIARPVLYVPLAQRVNAPSAYRVTLVVRMESDPSTAASAIRAAIHDVNPRQPIAATANVGSTLESLLSPDRFSARVMALLAAVGLFLSAIGLYTVIAYSVSQRTAEIGLRMALGAQPRSVVWLIAREAGVMVGVGMAISAPLMLTVARLLSDVLFSVRAGDPAILAALAALVALVTCLACAVPVRRALRLDPVRALQHE
jgi:predicted permease